MGRGISALFVAAVVSLVLAASAVALQPVQTDAFGETGSDATQLAKPSGVAVDQTSGDVFVADTENNRIDVFDAEGDFIRAWGWGVDDGAAEEQVCTIESGCQEGLAGKGEGQLNEVIGVAVSPVDGTVYALNRGDGRVQAFDQEGNFEGQFGGYEEGNPEKFSFPLAYGNDVAVDSKGFVYVSEGYATIPRIAVFSAAGTYERSITNDSGPGRLYNGSSIAIDSADNLYVDDPFANRVIVFDASGKYVRKEAIGLQANGLAVNPEDDHLFVQASRQNGEAKDFYTLYEYDAAGKPIEETPLPGLAESKEGFVSFGLAYSSAAAFADRAPGAIYAADLNADQVLILTSAKPGAPIIERVGVAAVGSGGADLSGAIDPNSAETTYTFEYGTTSGYGLRSPAVALSVGSGSDPVEVGTHLAGLAANTTYHYRLVATNSIGQTVSADRTFTTLASGGSSTSLPDGRAYELVSPVDKNLNDVTETLGLSSGDGNAVAFSAINGLPQAESGALLGSYVARRGADGWSTVAVSPRDTNNAGLLTGPPLIFSEDLNRAVVKSNDNLTGTAPASESGNLFLRTNSPLSYGLITPNSQKEEGVTTFTAVGASANFDRIFFQANAALTGDAPENGGVFTQLYEWSSGGGLKLAGVDPSGAPIANGAEAVANFGIPKPGTVSEDGSRVFFVSPTDFSTPAQLYERVNGTETIELSGSRRSTPDPYEPATGVTFQGAASNGSSAFFTSNVELTDDANTGENENGGFEGNNDAGANLYRYTGGTLTDLSVDKEVGVEKGADVRGVLIAAGGNVAYFGATGNLAPGATPGQPNLYRWSTGAGVQFVSSLNANDPFMSIGADVGATAQTTADGSVLIFTSTAALGGSNESGAGGGAVPEIYRYVAGGDVGCVSCANRGTPSNGAVVTPPAFPGGGANALSADGSRVFFETTDALVAADVNGTGDVYEWQGGSARLISSGTGSSDAILLDPSPSGNDVFFTTRQRLVATDTDDNVDVYDARVGGGFTVPTTPAACSGESCRPASAAPPAGPSVGSKLVDGSGNLTPKHQRKKHRKQRKAKQCKAKVKQGKRKCPGNRKRHSAGKRG